MGEVEAKKDRVTRHEFRHDRHTCSMLTDHLVFSPKYRGKVFEGEVAEATEEIVTDEQKEKHSKPDTLLVIPNFFFILQAPYLSTGYSDFIYRGKEEK
jgi:hypothetical protein